MVPLARTGPYTNGSQKRSKAYGLSGIAISNMATTTLTTAILGSSPQAGNSRSFRRETDAAAPIHLRRIADYAGSTVSILGHRVVLDPNAEQVDNVRVIRDVDCRSPIGARWRDPATPVWRNKSSSYSPVEMVYRYYWQHVTCPRVRRVQLQFADGCFVVITSASLISANADIQHPGPSRNRSEHDAQEANRKHAKNVAEKAKANGRQKSRSRKEQQVQYLQSGGEWNPGPQPVLPSGGGKKLRSVRPSDIPPAIAREGDIRLQGQYHSDNNKCTFDGAMVKPARFSFKGRTGPRSLKYCRCCHVALSGDGDQVLHPALVREDAAPAAEAATTAAGESPVIAALANAQAVEDAVLDLSAVVPTAPRSSEVKEAAPSAPPLTPEKAAELGVDPSQVPSAPAPSSDGAAVEALAQESSAPAPAPTPVTGPSAAVEPEALRPAGPPATPSAPASDAPASPVIRVLDPNEVSMIAQSKLHAERSPSSSFAAPEAEHDLAPSVEPEQATPELPAVPHPEALVDVKLRKPIKKAKEEVLSGYVLNDDLLAAYEEQHCTIGRFRRFAGRLFGESHGIFQAEFHTGTKDTRINTNRSVKMLNESVHVYRVTRTQTVFSCGSILRGLWSSLTHHPKLWAGFWLLASCVLLSQIALVSWFGRLDSNPCKQPFLQGGWQVLLPHTCGKWRAWEENTQKGLLCIAALSAVALAFSLLKWLTGLQRAPYMETTTEEVLYCPQMLAAAMCEYKNGAFEAVDASIEQKCLRQAGLCIPSTIQLDVQSGTCAVARFLAKQANARLLPLSPRGQEDLLRL